MTSCKEITDEATNKFPLKIQVEITFDSKKELRGAIHDMTKKDYLDWSYESELLEIFQSK